jgi:hypothetical protein
VERIGHDGFAEFYRRHRRGCPNSDPGTQHILEAGGWRLEAGGWRLEAGGWRLEAGGWRLEAGGWRLEAGGRRPT